MQPVPNGYVCARERGLFGTAALVGTLARLNGVG